MNESAIHVELIIFLLSSRTLLTYLFVHFNCNNSLSLQNKSPMETEELLSSSGGANIGVLVVIPASHGSAK
jgi:hypothetical protein